MADADDADDAHAVDDASIGDGLDWELFADPARLAFLRSLDERTVESSVSLDRVTRVAATASGATFAQVSLIGTTQFVPAAHGLTYGDDAQHTPIKDSLCSVTMASGGALQVDDARRHPWTRSLPPVTSGVVGAYLGVPLHDPDERPIGALCVFDPEPRAWRAEDVALLTDLAGLVARELTLLAALETAATTEVRLRHVITELVERPRLGEGQLLRARAAYRFPSGAPAGGDWVDWIELPDRIAFSIGDVAGHGLGSIRVMEDLRHALRAYAFEDVGPALAIAKTSELLRHFRPDEMATAIKADVDPFTGRAQFAVAGHLPPIHLSSAGAQLVPVTPGPPLGTLVEPPEVASVVLAPGDRLLVFTDGACERRGESIDAGLARLVRAMERHASTDDLDEAARGILDETIEELRDDACVLLVERPRH